MQDLFSEFPEEILASLLDNQYPEEKLRRFYGENIFSWVHKKLVWDFSLYTDLPKDLRSFLSSNFYLYNFADIERFFSKDGAVKYRFWVDKDNAVESVYIPKHSYRTVCLSSQVGCKWGCSFCYTGKMGFKFNLTTSQIIAQFYNIVKDNGVVTHIVFMGMGEPLDNYDEVIRAIKIFHHPKGQNISLRRITISTVGIIPAIERLITDKVHINLAISLHSGIAEVRAKLVPAERHYPVKKLLRVVTRYYELTKRQITFEYVVLPGINNDRANANALKKIYNSLDCKINLIVYHQLGMSNKEWKENKKNAIIFSNLLKQIGIKKVTVRKSRALDVAGACGQLSLLGSNRR